MIAPSVNVLRRTRRKPSTIRGAAPDVVIGQSTAARAGAHPYRRRRAQTFVVANQFDLVAFWIVKVERAPIDPFVFFDLNVQPQCLEPFPFGVVVGETNGESDVVNRRSFLIHRHRAIKQS